MSDALDVKRARARVGYALVAGAAMAWGSWPLILRHAPSSASLQSAFILLVLTVVSLPLMLRDRVRARATPAEWAGIAWLGVADALNVLLFFAAYQRASVAVTVLTHYLAPVFVALAAPFVLRERAGVRTILAAAFSLGGLVLLLHPWSADRGRSELVGAALGAGSAVFYASNVLVNKRLVRAFSASEMMFFHGLVATPLLFALVPLKKYAHATPASFGVLLLGALGPGALAGLCFSWGLRRIAASEASVLTLLEPFVAVALASAVLGEHVGLVGVLGGVLILAGAAFVVTGRPTKGIPAPGDGVESGS